MPEESTPYMVWIALLAVVSLVCVLGMIWGELTNHHLFTGACIGIVLLAYSFILLLLRKGGLSGV